MALIVRDPHKPFEVCDTDLDVLGADPETFYTLRPLTRDVIVEIDKKHTRMVLNKQTHKREPELDETEALLDKIDYVLVDWRGIVYDDGTPVPCTRENKIRAIGARRQWPLLRLADVNVASADADSFRRAETVRGVVGGRSAPDAVLSTPAGGPVGGGESGS